MKRRHKPGDERRALVVTQEEWDDRLNRKDPGYARSSCVSTLRNRRAMGISGTAEREEGTSGGVHGRLGKF